MDFGEIIQWAQINNDLLYSEMSDDTLSNQPYHASQAEQTQLLQAMIKQNEEEMREQAELAQIKKTYPALVRISLELNKRKDQ